MPSTRCSCTTTRSTRRPTTRRTPTTRSVGTDFPTAFSKLGVDLVLQGHDHSYSRSYEIKNGAKATPTRSPVRTRSSKARRRRVRHRQLGIRIEVLRHHHARTAANERCGNGADPLNPANYWYNSVQNQEHVRSYVKVQVKKDQLVVQTHPLRNLRRAQRGRRAEEEGALVRPRERLEARRSRGHDPGRGHHPPNHGDGQDIQVDVPTGAPGEFGWTINGHNGLVDMGTAQEKNLQTSRPPVRSTRSPSPTPARASRRGRSRRRWATSSTTA